MLVSTELVFELFLFLAVSRGQEFRAQKLAIIIRLCWSNFGDLDLHPKRLSKEHPCPKLNDIHGLVRLRTEHPCLKSDDVHGLVSLRTEHACPKSTDIRGLVRLRTEHPCKKPNDIHGLGRRTRGESWW